MQDAAYFYLNKAQATSKIIETLKLHAIMFWHHSPSENTDNPVILKQIVDG
jgi:hypothetical protein